MKLNLLRTAAIALAIQAGLSLRAATVTVFAAASLRDSLQEIAASYEQRTGGRIVCNFAASGVLARQIEEGAPADLFISADEASADALQAKGLLVKATRTNLLGNSIVLIAASDNATVRSPGDLTNAAVKRVALGDPKTVPAGSYAKAYLERSGLWRGIEPKVVPCENVRAVLAAVESGNVEAGLVYKTDAAISRKVKVVCELPDGGGLKIIYPAALVKGAPQEQAARKFLDFLAGSESGAAFARRGFVVLSGAPK